MLRTLSPFQPSSKGRAPRFRSRAPWRHTANRSPAVPEPLTGGDDGAPPGPGPLAGVPAGDAGGARPPPFDPGADADGTTAPVPAPWEPAVTGPLTAAPPSWITFV